MLKMYEHLLQWIDIDECAEGIVKIGTNSTGLHVGWPANDSDSSGGGSNIVLWCEQLCNNTIGGYECECDIGYFLEDNNTTCLGELSKLLNVITTVREFLSIIADTILGQFK